MTITDADLEALDPDGHDTSLPALITRRITGRYTIDEWGYDPDVMVALSPLATLRWSAEVQNAEAVPEIGGAVLVYNRRLGLGEPLLLAAAVGRATGRPIRFSGVPDRAPLGPFLRRIGGVPDGTDDLRVLLRAGEIVTVPLDRELRPSFRLGPFRSGAAPAEPLAVALDLGVPVLPVAISGFEPGRKRLIVIGAPIVTRRRRAVIAANELAAVVGERVRELLTSDPVA